MDYRLKERSSQKKKGNIMNRLLFVIASIQIITIIAVADNITDSDTKFENITTANESDAAAWLASGDDLFNESRYNESLAAYDRAIELNNSFAEAWQRRGRVLRSLERFNDSLDSYDRAIELNPNSSSPWSGKGDTFSKMGRYNESLLA
ncbi:MAG: tetratricopeptide repeat protein, partial [Methanothrix sp.]|nr:tetratricopeptide repeat protein [Methanothrix sp.]